MAFVIQAVARDVFDFFWTPDVKRKLRSFVHPPDAASLVLQQQTWAVDEGVKACLLPVSLLGQAQAAWCYAFVMNGEFAVVQHESYCVYSFVGISPDLVEKLDGVKRLIAEALRVGGEFLDGKAGANGLFAVPDAQFMVGISGLVGALIGIPLGVFLRLTDEGGVLRNAGVNRVVGGLVNAVRSTPFIILLVAIIPLTRFLTGSSIGTAAAVVPLTIAAAPFIARLVEASLREVDHGLIEAAQAMAPRATARLPTRRIPRWPQRPDSPAA